MVKKSSRIDIIGQNGNEGLHYARVIPEELFQVVFNRCIDDEIRLKLSQCKIIDKD